MSVFTSVSADQLNSFLLGYTIGKLCLYEGIVKGVTNSNFWLETEGGSFVLTLYEHHGNSDLDYILGLQHHLRLKGIACSAPVINSEGNFYSTLNDKPAAINQRVSGVVSQSLSVWHCQQVGSALAEMHLAGTGYKARRDNPCGSEWRLLKQQELARYMEDADRQLLAEEIESYRLFDELDLPGGPVHADLFHDNCLFNDDRLGGIIDFDYACNDTWLYDLAITLNDWCNSGDGELDAKRMRALLQSYERIRPLLNVERDNLALMLRLASVRFWLSRLYDKTFPLDGELTYCKDPHEFKQMLLLRRQGIPSV